MIDSSLPVASRLPVAARLAAYLRDSGGRDQELSVLQQRQAAGQWCKANGYVLTRLFEDAARTGTKTAGRDSFLEMIEHFSSPACQEKGLLLWDYSRLSRDYDDTMYYLAELRRRGFLVLAIHDTIPEGLEGRLLESIIAWKNAKFSQDLSRNIKRGMQFVISHHHAYIARFAPVGYKKIKKVIGLRRDGADHAIPVLVPDPETAPRVRRAFEMRAQGYTVPEINKETRLFNCFPSYSRMFRHPIYVGAFSYDGHVIENYCEPLIDEETWRQVQHINQQLHDKHIHPRTAGSPFLLTGLIYCQVCGRRLRGSSTRQFLFYRCTYPADPLTVGYQPCQTKTISKKKIEKIVLEEAAAFLRNARLLASVYAELHRQSQSHVASLEPQAKELKASLRSVADSIERLVSAIAEHGHSQALLASLAEKEQRRQNIEQEIQKLACQAEAEKRSQPLSLEAILSNAARLAEKLQTADRRTQKQLLRTLIKAIRVTKISGKIQGDIEFYAPPPPDGGLPPTYRTTHTLALPS